LIEQGINNMTEPTKKRPGRWKTGESGNPAGRPPGAGEVSKLRAAIGARVPELLAAMMDKALDGDVGAARLLLERSIAPLKASEQTQSLSLPDGTLTQQGRAVLASVAAGELSPGQGAQLLSAIGSLARVTEMDELTTRITTLEQHHAAKS
jgi:hypothetical protein